MNITIDKLKEWGAGKNITDAAGECGNGINAPDLIEKLIKNSGPEPANWLICRVFDGTQKAEYAVYAAEKTLPVFEKKYRADKRPREAVKAANAWIKNPSGQARAAAASACRAAHASAPVAGFVYASDYAPRIAAHSAAFAAGAAADNDAIKTAAAAITAAHAYAYAGVYDDAVAIAVSDADAFSFADAYSFADAAAVKKAMMEKILKYGLKILRQAG